MMPAPIAPALTPNAPRPFESSLPKLTPAHGFTYPSARATVGVTIRATAAAITSDLMRRCISLTVDFRVLVGHTPPPLRKVPDSIVISLLRASSSDPATRAEAIQVLRTPACGHR